MKEDKVTPVSLGVRVLGWMIALLPMWWVLGVEQFLWPPVACLLALKVVVRDGVREKGWILRWFGLLILIMLLSSTAIEKPERWVTFVRNLGMYVGAAALLIAVVGLVRSANDVRALVRYTLIGMLFAVVAGTTAILGIWRDTFPSVVGFMLPDWIAATRYGGEIAFRDVGGYQRFFVEYFRLSSFFMFPNGFGAALVAVIPMGILTATRLAGWKRWAAWGGIGLAGLNLLFTAGRVPIAALILGGVVLLLLRPNTRRIVLWIGGGLAALAVTVGGILFLAGQGERALAPILVVYQGRGFADRGRIVVESARGIRDRPLLGAGTQRDFPTSQFPAGSHNYYLGMAYKHGLFGLIAFVGLLCVVWRETDPSTLRGVPEDSYLLRFLLYGRWVFSSLLVIGATEVLDLDATAMFITWLFLSLLVVARRLLGAEEAALPSSG